MHIKKIYIKIKKWNIYQQNIENLKFIKNKLAFKIRTALKDFLSMSKKVIEKKYDDYIENNDNLKDNVSNIIKNIYNIKKDDALEISKTVLDVLSVIEY